MLIVDGANVVGSRPDGWWRDRAGAADRLVSQVRIAVVEARIEAPVIVVLEGQARAGVPEGEADGAEVVHAAGEGDDTIVELAAGNPGATVVTADRGLIVRAQAVEATTVGPRWLLSRLET